LKFPQNKQRHNKPQKKKLQCCCISFFMRASATAIKTRIICRTSSVYNKMFSSLLESSFCSNCNFIKCYWRPTEFPSIWWRGIDLVEMAQMLFPNWKVYSVKKVYWFKCEFKCNWPQEVLTWFNLFTLKSSALL
jgi:hypothetical protein